mgnify:CR=1 FL=1
MISESLNLVQQQTLDSTDSDKGKKHRRNRSVRQGVKKSMPAGAVGCTVVIEEIDMNGKSQKVEKKTYQMMDGSTKIVTVVQ